MRTGADVFVFCHAPDNMIAPFLCRELHQRVAKAMKVPAFPWDTMKPESPEQPSLFEKMIVVIA